MNERAPRGEMKKEAQAWAKAEAKNLKEWDDLVAEYEKDMASALSKYDALSKNAEAPLRKRIEANREAAGIIDRAMMKSLAAHDFDQLRRLISDYEDSAERLKELQEKVTYREASPEEAETNAAAMNFERELADARKERDAARKAAQLAEQVFEEGDEELTENEDPKFALKAKGVIEDVDRELDRKGIVLEGDRAWFYRQAMAVLNRGDQAVVDHVENLAKRNAHLSGPKRMEAPGWAGRS